MTDDGLTVEQHIAEAQRLLTKAPGPLNASYAIAHNLSAIAQMMAADRGVPDAEVIEDEGCPSELMGRCDALPGVVGNYVHHCTADPGHDGLHECGCGRVWGNRDDD